MAWATLKAKVDSRPTAGASTAVAATKFLSDADDLRAFRQDYPQHPQVRAAKQLEAVALAFVALRGDTTQDQRRTSLVDDVRGDPSIPVTRRFEAVAWSKQVAIARQRLAGRAEFLAAHEAAGRQLIGEFPGFAGGYESLLGVARDSAPERGKVIARDLVGMGGVPAFVKDEANLLLGRFDLLGRSIDAILTAAGAAPLPAATRGKGVVVYAWSGDSAPSLALASRLAAKAPNAAFVGINLDSDPESARQIAGKTKLPGIQYYDARGAAGPLAAALKLDRPPAAYLVDGSGVIRDVQGAVGFAQKVSQLSH